jgi:hypothetical protein
VVERLIDQATLDALSLDGGILALHALALRQIPTGPDWKQAADKVGGLQQQTCSRGVQGMGMPPRQLWQGSVQH